MSGWNPNTFLQRCLTTALLSLLLLSAGCPASKQQNASGDIPPPPLQKTRVHGEVLRISQRNEPGDLDPAAASIPDEFFLIRALGEGLVTPDPKGGEPVPAAAQSWDVSADGLTYTFHLRASCWSDGSPVTASDFVDSYRRILSPSTAAPKASLFFMIAGARAFVTGRSTDFSSVGLRALNPTTLEIRLERPCPGLLAYAASGPWIPVHSPSIHKHGKAWTRPGNHVGNGPYLLEEWQPHRSIVLRRRADYWDAASVSIDRLQFLAFDNAEAEERAFRAGQLDVSMSLPISKLAGYQERNPEALRLSPLEETRYLSFNTQHPPLNDPRVRRALGMAVDREEICERVLHAGQVPAYRFLHPMLAKTPAPTIGKGTVEEARRLLAEAGFPGGKNMPVLELSGWSNLPVLEAIQAMWRTRLGLETKIALRDAKVHVSTILQGRYDIALLVAVPDVDDPLDILSNFTEGAPSNYPHWKDQEYTSSVLSVEQAPSTPDREKWIQASEQRLLSEQPVAPLYFNTRSYLIRPRVHGWIEDGLWNRYYKNITLTPEYQPE